MKRNFFTRTFSVMLVAVVLTLSLPLTAFAADETEPQYSIIHTPDGGTISVDPNVTKVDEIPNYLFEDPLGSSRSMMEGRSARAAQELKGSYTVDEYGDFWIQTPPEAVGTVSWSVSNSFLASVDSSGTVYVNTAGAFFVLADFTDSSGSARTFRYDVLIELPNGIFKFKNKANNLYITLPNGNIATGTQYVQQSAGTDRNSEFKITKVGTGLYTIRSMVANHVGLSKSSSDLVNSVVETGPLTDPNNEAYIDTVDLWSIGSNARGYYIYNAMGSAGVYTITPTSNSNYTLTYLDANDNCHWTFVSVVANKHGVDIRNSTDTLAVGDTFQFTATMYSSYYNVHGQHPINWTVTPGTGSATINNTTGLLTGVSPGTVTVTAIYMNSNTSLRWVASMTVEIVERYSYELVNTFGFSESDAALIRLLYDKVDAAFPNESNIVRAWKCSRLLGGLVYGHGGLRDAIEWNDVAGSLYILQGEQAYFVNTLGFTNTQYNDIKSAVQAQYNSSSSTGECPDFAHLQITISARLAYHLDEDSVLSNIGTFCTDEDVSHLAGWLGDATLVKNGVSTSFGNDDYCADLDAENIYRLIINNQSSINAINSYYTNLTNRANVFLSYISYDTVCDKVFYELIDKELLSLLNEASVNHNVEETIYYRDLLDNESYHWNVIQSNYPDTYDFLLSLQNRLHEMGDY